MLSLDKTQAWREAAASQTVFGENQDLTALDLNRSSIYLEAMTLGQLLNFSELQHHQMHSRGNNIHLMVLL